MSRASGYKPVFITILFIAQTFFPALVEQAWAFPMKPDIRVLLDQAKQPRQHYVPARAGWNGPEEKSGTLPNPIYDQMRREPTPLEVREGLLAAARPDWRLLLVIAMVILGLRVVVRGGRHTRQANVIVFPAAPVLPQATEAAEAA